MTVNVKLLEQVMQHIEDHPEQHQQYHWFNDCGTAACFAGWTCQLSGFMKSPRYGSRVIVGSTTEAAQELATELLGLTEDARKILFHACNTREMLQRMVKDLANGDDLRSRDEYADESRA